MLELDGLWGVAGDELEHLTDLRTHRQVLVVGRVVRPAGGRGQGQGQGQGRGQGRGQGQGTPPAGMADQRRISSGVYSLAGCGVRLKDEGGNKGQIRHVAAYMNRSAAVRHSTMRSDTCGTVTMLRSYR